MTAGSSAPDFSAPARRPSERLAIVEFVASTATLEETDYLEWKSAYDLTTKPGAAAIARQLIGFANRDPIKAARHAGGLAYVLVGAQAGSVIGAPHWDSADIENWLAPFVQPELSYDVHYVPIDDELVLFITVEPPRQGDPIFALQRSSEDPDDRKALAEGTIFVRHGGKTERHTAGDLQRLTARAQKTDGPTLAVDVAVKSSDLHAIAESRLSSAACERYVMQHRHELLASLPEVQSPFATAFEDRTEDEFRAEVDHFIGEARRRFPTIVLFHEIEHSPSTVACSVTNATPDNFEDAVIELIWPLPRAGIHSSVGAAEDDLRVPFPPQAWGKGPRIDRIRGLSRLLHGPPPEVEEQDVQTTLVRFPPRRLRPHTTEHLPEILLALMPAYAGQQIPVRWRATAANTRGDLTGTLVVDVQSVGKSHDA